MKNILNRLLIVFIFILSVCLSYSQNDTSEVGINEKLGQKILLDLTFVEDNGDTVKLRDLITKPTVFSFVYFDCPGLCSPLLEGVGDVIKKTDLKLGKDYQVITISFNFRDTPEKAKKKKETFVKRYAKNYSDGWIFLTTDSATIFKIVNSFGYKIKSVGMDFVHPSAIVLVSPEGMITRYLYGINFLPFDLKMAITEAQNEQVRPTIQKVLLYCFSYDPQGKRYAFEVTKVSATIIIFIVVVFFIRLLLKSGRKKSIKNDE